MSTRPAAAPVNRADDDASPSSSYRDIVSDYGLVGTVGLGVLLLALLLAPLFGGYPSGALYENDVTLNALRALVCAAALCLPFGRSGSHLPAPSLASERGGAGGFGIGALWVAAGLAALSLLVHSRVLTSPVLLFAMVPATLDWLCYALIATVAWRLASADRRASELIVGTLAVGAAISAAFIAIESYRNGMGDHRSTGLFFDPNFAGGFLALTLPPLAALCLAAKERIGALVTGVVAALAFGALMATGSRAGVAAACLGLLAALVLAAILALRVRSEDARPMPWARVAALAVAFAVMGFVFRGPLLSRSEAGGDEHSGSFRSLTWKGTVALAKANPLLGAGPGTYDVRYPRYALVEKTNLAHSSYLQTAAEEGFPALAAAAIAIAAALAAGAAGLLRRGGAGVGDPARRLLLCGLIGGLLAGALRSLFDSEWSILGNALPFWTVLGLILAKPPSSPVAGTPLPVAGRGAGGKAAWAAKTAGAVGLALSLVLFYGSQARDAALAALRSGSRPSSVPSVWPPDPELLFATGQPDEAARVEPSGRQFYRLARYAERSGDLAKAVDASKRSLDADPNALQTWRLHAELEERSGDHAAALAAWRELTKRYEGLPGQVRAVPELTETFPAFAYAAVADDAAARGDRAEAASLYEKAAAVVESYSRTSPVYQQMELGMAKNTGVSVLSRRQELKDLYEKVVAGWTKAAPERAAELASRRDETFARIDKMEKPAADGGTG